MIGIAILVVGAMPYTDAEETSYMAYVGLGLVALGTGGVKPCVPSFGGDQFSLPQQEKHLNHYFTWLYFLIQMGALSATIITPITHEIDCMGEDTCYPLAFGLPGCAMFLALGKQEVIIILINLYLEKKNITSLSTELHLAFRPCGKTACMNF